MDRSREGQDPREEVVDWRRRLTIREFVRLVDEPCVYRLSRETRDRLGRTQALHDSLIARGRQIYGVTTGFGPLVAHEAHASSEEHQAHLIYHLATGTGELLPPRVVRGILIDRLFTLARGHSAASPELLEELAALLEARVEPAVPAFGSVGASGDLTPMAHIALAMMGEGAFIQGPAERVLAILNRKPFRFARRDALALVNGTSASVALALLSWSDVAQLLPAALASMALMSDVLAMPRDAWAPVLHDLRGHPGQRAVATILRDALTGSETPAVLQAPYSFRCIPQIVGPAVDALVYSGTILLRELHGVTDNPLFDPDGDPDGDSVYHGGNFHGMSASFACDAITLAMATVATIMDRQIARITDTLLNGTLPPFLTPRAPGGHSGLMGLQVSATALAAELNAAAGNRYALETRSTNGANQDVVSMSTLAGWRLYQAVFRLRDLVAMHAITAAQAWDCHEISAGGQEPPVVYQVVRRVVPALDGDRPLAREIAALADTLGSRETTGAFPADWLTILGVDV